MDPLSNESCSIVAKLTEINQRNAAELAALKQEMQEIEQHIRNIQEKLSTCEPILNPNNKTSP